MLSEGGDGRAQTTKDMRKFFRSNNRSLFCMLITFHTWITHFMSEPRRHNWAAWASAVDGYGMCGGSAVWRRQWRCQMSEFEAACSRMTMTMERRVFSLSKKKKMRFFIPEDLMTDKNSRFSFTILILMRSTLKTFPSRFTLKVMGTPCKTFLIFHPHSDVSVEP